MTRKTKKTVETLTHYEASRKNIPTAEYQSVMRKDEQSPVRVAYERRNRDLDPQLVWRGKDEQDWFDLVVQAPPLYIQEKVHPKVLIDDLRRQTEIQEKAGIPQQIDLFADFNGLPDKARSTEFYQHDANWTNRMFQLCARESKQPPDYSGTDNYEVFLTLYGKVQDSRFLTFLEKIGRERQMSFESTDFITLDLINREQKLPPWAKERVQSLIESGAIERVGRKLILSGKFFEFVDRKGVYTRKRGLDRETNKQLLLKHITDNQKTGSRFSELKEVLPSLSRDQVQKLLAEMKNQMMITVVGKTSATKWYPYDMVKGQNKG